MLKNIDIKYAKVSSCYNVLPIFIIFKNFSKFNYESAMAIWDFTSCFCDKSMKLLHLTQISDQWIFISFLFWYIHFSSPKLISFWKIFTFGLYNGIIVIYHFSFTISKLAIFSGTLGEMIAISWKDSSPAVVSNN